jgi:TRAP-type C4-dicarboxylate transport system permease small subunit
VGGPKAALRRLDDALARLEDRFIIAAHGIIAALVLLAVILRYGFNSPITWSEELVVGLFTWMVFVGAAAAIRSHIHIRIDIMGGILAHPRMQWLNLLTLLAGIAIIGTMLWACHEYVLQEVVVESPMLGVSKGWFAAAMPTGLVLMLVHILRDWMDHGAAPVFRGETETLVASEADAR